jgi:hypothetical protein
MNMFDLLFTSFGNDKKFILDIIEFLDEIGLINQDPGKLIRYQGTKLI